MEKRKKYLISKICSDKRDCNINDENISEIMDYYPYGGLEWSPEFRMSAYGELDKNDFVEAIKRIRYYYKNVEYFSKLMNIASNLKKDKKDFLVLNGVDYDRGEVVYRYLHYWEKLGYFVSYGGALDEILLGDILLRVNLKLNKREVMSLLYWGNIGRNRFKTYSDLEKHIQKIKIKEVDNDVVVYFVNNMNKRMVERLGRLDNLYHGIGYDISISFAGFILNPNNFSYYNNCNFERFLAMSGGNGRLFFMALRNYIVKNVDNIDLERFLLFSSIILYLYGIRQPSDIDLTVYTHPDPSKSLNEFLIRYTKKQGELLGIADLSACGYGDWIVGGKKEYLNRWFMKDWPNRFGAKDYSDMIFNPRYHMNIMGLKVLVINADIERRRTRYRPASYADLIGYNIYMNDKVEIEEPPERYYYLDELVNEYDTPEKIKKLLLSVKWYLMKRYGIKKRIIGNNEVDEYSKRAYWKF